MSAALLLLAIVTAVLPPVRVQDNEVWLNDRQLTHDGRPKHEAILSPARDRIVYGELCASSHGCAAEVVILDLSGNRLAHFQITSKWLSDVWTYFEDLTWIAGGKRIAVSRPESPSLEEYVELDAASGKAVRDLLGIWFTSSPDGNHVASVGSIRHFTPPWSQSYSLEIDGVTVYPLRPGERPTANPKEDFHMVGRRVIGVHTFSAPLVWSPAGRRVAFVDCLADWVTTDNRKDDEEIERGCSLVAVAPSGRFSAFRLPKSRGESRISWSGEYAIRYRKGDVERVFHLTRPAPKKR